MTPPVKSGELIDSTRARLDAGAARDAVSWGAMGPPGRLAGKIALVIGAGQTPGDTVGNGRATAILFAREGARVVAVDRDLASAAETVGRIESEGGLATALAGDATREEEIAKIVRDTVAAHGRIDILHNNVGIGAGDAGAHEIEIDAWDRILAVNLKSTVIPCKHVVPVMREQRGGSIITISSIAAVCATPTVAYKTSKAGLNAYNQALAMSNAKYGIRANVIMPGLMETPMAVEGLAEALAIDKRELIRRRNQQVPLGGKMGTAWDVAYAALFLASDEARFITGAVLPVDGGQSIRIG
jgi:NAD(P)-dependent dehydrogenase (short-subunit alcohol dehydrogenase family)